MDKVLATEGWFDQRLAEDEHPGEHDGKIRYHVKGYEAVEYALQMYCKDTPKWYAGEIEEISGTELFNRPNQYGRYNECLITRLPHFSGVPPRVMKRIARFGTPCQVTTEHGNAVDETQRVCKELVTCFWHADGQYARDHSKKCGHPHINYQINPALEKIERACCPGMALRAELSRILVYEVGGFVAPHRDAYLGENHVGTLVVPLTNDHEGGKLVVEGEAMASNTYVAFFGDALHEVRPVTSGTRIVAVFKLYRAGVHPLAHVDIFDRKAFLSLSPAFVGVLVVLERAYAAEAIARGELSGRDAAVFALVRRCCLDATLVAVTQEVGDEYYRRNLLNRAYFICPEIVSSAYEVRRPNAVSENVAVVHASLEREDGDALLQTPFEDLGTSFTYFRRAAIAVDFARARREIAAETIQKGCARWLDAPALRDGTVGIRARLGLRRLGLDGTDASRAGTDADKSA